jgi:hypothetical protein
MNDRQYVIFDMSEVGTINFSEVMETSVDTLRLSVDGTKSFVKYEGTQPASVAALTTKTQEYSHTEILEILATSEWTAPINQLPTG